MKPDMLTTWMSIGTAATRELDAARQVHEGRVKRDAAPPSPEPPFAPFEAALQVVIPPERPAVVVVCGWIPTLRHFNAALALRMSERSPVHIVGDPSPYAGPGLWDFLEAMTGSRTWAVDREPALRTAAESLARRPISFAAAQDAWPRIEPASAVFLDIDAEADDIRGQIAEVRAFALANGALVFVGIDPVVEESEGWRGIEPDVRLEPIWGERYASSRSHVLVSSRWHGAVPVRLAHDTQTGTFEPTVSFRVPVPGSR